MITRIAPLRRAGTIVSVLLLLFALAGTIAPAFSQNQPFRPPAVPLVTFDPYLSIWSEADHLTDDVTRHWTGHPHPLVGLIRIDGKTYRLMGNDPANAPALPQASVTVLPTRSIYEFAGAGVHVTLTFMRPALPDDLAAFSLPLSYITYQVRSTDGHPHKIQLYDSTSSLIAVNDPGQQVVCQREEAYGLMALKAGTPEQNYFDVAGDDARLDWGYVYAAAPSRQAQATSAMGADADLIASFENTGSLPMIKRSAGPQAATEAGPVLAFAFDLGNVGAQMVERHVIVAYDEVYAISYFGQPLRPYWRSKYSSTERMLAVAERDYPKLTDHCIRFDLSLMEDLTRAGGPQYAQIAALSYRQSLAACGLAADSHGQPLFFTKENTSNGDISTMDVIFPMSPELLLLSPSLMKAMLVPDLAYAASPHWKFPNAPHDLGTYPVVTGRDDGGEGMPVEESGNMILMLDAVAKEENSAEFASQWWPQITQWAHYLEKYGNDPGDQLCTDDFMGHLAHNANLSVKAILALAAYGDLCRRRGDTKTAARYQSLARTYARHWMAVDSDGDHYRLAFDKPGTWSQLYNLVWDRILGLNVFPPSVAKTEVAYYLKKMQPYGVPLDSRTKLTKTDWSLWSATLADNPSDFKTIVSHIYGYLNTTSSRVPLVDSYVTDDPHSSGMHARPVVGGIFVKMLTVPSIWQSWSDRDHAMVGNWAPLPVPPQITVVVPTGQTWQYTTNAPAVGWTQPNFDDSGWLSGLGGFGTKGTPAIAVGTTWNTDDIWIRRQIKVPASAKGNLELLVFHDEDVEIYVNGVLAAKAPGFVTSYQPMPISPTARRLLVPGATVTIAAHCHQTIGGQGVDIGLVRVTPR
jgi:hypothetical protein